MMPLKMIDTDCPNGYARCITPDGKRICRRVYGKQLGNFVMLSVRYRGAWYNVGQGDEYIRGDVNEFQIEEKRKKRNYT